MEKRKLTTKQAKFLKKVQLEYPFNQIDWTISNVLEDGVYSENQKVKINNMIERWKQHKEKFD